MKTDAKEIRKESINSDSTKSMQLVNQLIDKNTSLLRSGTLSSFKFRETFLLERAGSKDGKKGMPKEHNQSIWTSPNIDKEINKYLEFCDSVWGELEITTSPSLVDISKLLDQIAASSSRVSELKAHREKLEVKVSPDRRNGEDSLSESLVMKRRKREYNRSLNSVDSNLSNSINSHNANLVRLSEILASVYEAINLSNTVCEKMKDHSMQRIDIYWNAARHVHPKREQMPVIPNIQMNSEAEKRYMDQHRELFDLASLLLNRSTTTERYGD